MTHSHSCKGSKRYRYCICGTAMHEGWTKCPAPSVPAGEIERFLVEQIQIIGTDEVRRLLAGLEDLWQTTQPREQARLTSLLVDSVDVDGVAGHVGITFHDTGMQSLTTESMEVLA